MQSRFTLAPLSILPVALLVSSALLSSALAVGPTSDSLATVKANVESGKAILVDVREQSEWDRGHLERSVLLPLSSLNQGGDAEQVGKKVPKGKIVYTFCVVGKRAVTAGNVIERLGYEVRPLKPGYRELLRAGFKPARD